MLADWGDEAAEDRDEYVAESIFWVPPEARWPVLQAQARQSTIGTAVDERHGRHRAGQPGAATACCPRTTPVPPWTRPAWAR